MAKRRVSFSAGATYAEGAFSGGAWMAGYSTLAVIPAKAGIHFAFLSLEQDQDG
jgi:hypothetical protein